MLVVILTLMLTVRLSLNLTLTLHVLRVPRYVPSFLGRSLLCACNCGIGITANIKVHEYLYVSSHVWFLLIVVHVYKYLLTCLLNSKKWSICAILLDVHFEI